MEKDSFERQLERIVSQADQTTNNASNRDRVWNNVKLKNKTQKWWWIASAAAIIVCFVFAFYQINEPLKTIHVVKNKPLNIPKTPSEVSLPKKELTIASKRTQTKQQSVKQPELNTQVMEQPVFRLVETKPINTVAAPQITTIKTIVETTVQNHPKNEVEPEFTVQFKKGTATVNNVDQGQVFTALKKFKLKRDTTYFATVEEKQPNRMKLSFKKEN